MKKQITVLTLCATLFALSFPADAQQAGKIFRIGFLDLSSFWYRGPRGRVPPGTEQAWMG